MSEPTETTEAPARSTADRLTDAAAALQAQGLDVAADGFRALAELHGSKDEAGGGDHE